MTVGKIQEHESLGIKDILQINATIIAGSLVLLTISSLNDTVFTQQENKYMIAQVVMGITVIFGLSSLAALLGTLKMAKWVMIGGFGYLIQATIFMMITIKLT